MKVGIITFQRAYNYGAVLQAYALCESINAFGYSCEVIDYHCPRFENDYKEIRILNCKTAREFVSALIYGRKRNKKRNAFVSFVENELRISEKKYYKDNISESNAIYDCFITGSDQVWNLSLTDEDWNFFLNFVDSDRKRISYAASIVSMGNSCDTEKQIIDALGHFSYISVREKSGVDYLTRLGIKRISLVLDPTLLFTSAQWCELANRHKTDYKLPAKYLLAYFVSPNDSTYKYMYKLSKTVNLPVVLINYTHHKVKGVTNLLYVSPGEFVSLFMNASMVITNSFHGTAFSINLNKEFYYIIHQDKKEKNERLLSLMDVLEIKDRDYTQDPSMRKINWDRVNKRLAQLRDLSINSLKNGLNNGGSNNRIES